MPYFLCFLPLIILFLICGLTHTESRDRNLEDVEQGKMTKLTYKDHSYVAWSINSGGGIVHDPDCKCQTKELK